MDWNDPFSIAEDERAQIPFAVIGVLLLVTSVSIVVVLETRSEPEVDTDAAQAYDRTSSAVRSVVQGAATSAFQQAAAQPVTVPNRSTAVGQALAAGPSGGADSGEVFSRYAQLRVYLALQERLGHANQSIRDDTVTRVSMPEHDDPADAIDALTLHVGGDQLDYGDPGGSDLPYGAVRVTVPDVEIVVERDGEVVGTRTQDYTVTVGSSVFALHDRTNRYEDALNTDLGDREGYGRYLSARLNRFAWHRGHAQANGAPVAEVLADRHVETLANDALYATQRDVFGNEDPYADRQLARAYGCMLATDAHGLYNASEIGRSSADGVSDRAADPGFCSGRGSTYADVNRPLPDAPDWTQLVPERTDLSDTHRISLDRPASTAFGETTSNGALETAIERVYTVDVTVDSDVKETVIPPLPDDAIDVDRTAIVDYQAWVEDAERVVDPESSAQTQPFYRYHVVYHAYYLRSIDRSGGGTTVDAASVRYDVNLTVRGEHSPNATVDDVGLDYDYEPGGAGAPNTTYGRNFADAPGNAVEASLSGVTDVRNASEQIEEHLNANGGSVYDEDDLYDVLTESGGNVRIHPEPYQVEELRGWLIQDLRSLEADASAPTIRPERRELLRNESPLLELRDSIAGDEWIYRRADGSRYVNAPDMARAELRRAYMERLRDRVDAAVTSHNQSLAELDDQVRATSNASLDRTVEFAGPQLEGDEVQPTPDRQTYGLLADVELSPDPEPTYLTFQRINVSHVPSAGDPPAGFAPLSGRHESRSAVPSETVTTDPDRVRLETAGRVYRSANETVDHLPDRSLRTDLADLEDSLEDERARIVEQTARAGARPFPDVSPADLEPYVRAEIHDRGGLGDQVVDLAHSGTVRGQIANDVAREYTVDATSSYRYSNQDFRQHLAAGIRYGLVDAVGTNGVVEGSIAEETGRLSARTRAEIAGAAEDASASRREQAARDSLVGNASVTGVGQRWLQSNRSAGRIAPGGIAAGRPLTNVTGWHVLTTNVWNVELAGEYSRFTVRATAAGDASDRRTEYVREDGRVTLAYDGTAQTVGETEAVSFDTNTSVVVAVPGDSLGVGDRTDDPRECSESFPETGSLADDRGVHACAGT